MKNFEDTGIKKLISLIKAKFDSLAKVATSGSYTDLSNKPTIPSVGNGKITIKQGRTTKGTFTVNQSGATTIELTDNDTHYASGTVVTNDATKTGNYGAALTNGNVYLNHVENGAVKNSHKITGSGATTVTSDASGNIIITSTDNNTTYGVATSSTLGLVKSGTDITVDSSGNVSVNNDSHSHSDYVKKSGSEVSSLNAITAETSTTSVIIPNATAIASSPFARDFWHDHFAFLRGGTSIIDNQVSTDGTTWTDDDSDLTSLFIQKETYGTTILSASQLAHRFTIYGNNIKHSYITWFEIGVTYTSPFSSFEVHIESSSDNNSWSTAHKSIVSGTSVPVFLKQNTHTSSNGYLRFTFTKTTNITTGSVKISCLKAFTSRKGNQGLGIDYEYPYDWNSNMDIYPVTNNKSTLGTSSLKWANVYATKFTGALTGNAGTATKWATARNINGMLVQGDANRVNYGVCSTAATTAAKTVDCAGFTLITGAEITVKFTNTNSAAQPTLNVNNQGARAIYYRGNIIPPSYLAEKRVYTFRYDGKNFELVGDINTDTNTDTKVTNELKTTTKAYVTGTTSSTATHTGTQIFDTGVYLDTTAGRLTATSFKGALVGNADTATKDSADQQITTTYIKGLSASGKIITYTKGDGSTGTITTQDTTYSTGTETKAGITKLYSNLGTSTDGTMTQLAIGDALAGKAGTLHTHTKSQIRDFPTSLKNPNGLRVQVNGDGASEIRYDGSVAKTINIKAGSNITITSDSSGNITISSTASAGSVTGDVGTVVYEATSGGLYCDGNTSSTTDNSIGIEDSNFSYKRFRFYCQGYYGLVCVDMPLDREHPAYITTNGTRYGGVIFPTAENGNINNNTGIGPSNHMYYELKWRVTKETAGWRVSVVDSGWLGLNAGKTTNADYASNASTSNAGTGYISWNQRHNNGYCIYKIVAYTD